MSIPVPVARSWHRVRRPLTRRRRLYVAVNRMRRSRRDLLASRSSVLVIEGPMRSGNTFCVAAFVHVNGEAAHVGRHLHAPAHVLHAVALGIPTIVLVRDPVDACISHVIRRPELTLRDSLRDYVDFYRTLEPVRDRIVVAPFERAIHDFGSVLKEVNARFGTDFDLYLPSPANDAAVMRKVESMGRAENGGQVDENGVARPSAERRAQKEQLLQELRSPELAELAGAATDRYERWSRAR